MQEEKECEKEYILLQQEFALKREIMEKWVIEEQKKHENLYSEWYSIYIKQYIFAKTDVPPLSLDSFSYNLSNGVKVEHWRNNYIRNLYMKKYSNIYKNLG